MTNFVVFASIPLLVAAAAGLYFWIRHRKRSTQIFELLHDPHLLAQWTYDPTDWRTAVNDEFTWASKHDLTGQCFISPSAVYVRSEHRDRLIDLARDGKVVTYASFLGTAGSPLKLRVRWKVVWRDDNGVERVKYYKEDIRIPVPRGAEAAALKVAEFFTMKIQADLTAYTNVLSDEDPISLFGEDSF